MAGLKDRKRPRARKCLGTALRTSNLWHEGMLRRDGLLPRLTLLAFRDPVGFGRMYAGVSPALQHPKSELMWALKGYFAYLREEYPLAADCFLEALILSPENFDNWNDLAFALRHTGQYAASQEILFRAPGLIQLLSRCAVEGRKPKLLKMLKLKPATWLE